MLCPNCGHPIEDGAAFCKSCGAPASQADPPPPPGLAQAAPPPPAGFAQAPPPQAPPPAYMPGWQPPQGPGQGRSRTGLIVASIAAAVIVLAGLGVGLYFGLRGDDSDKTATSRTTVVATTSSSTESTSTSTTEAAFAQEEGEIFLEAAGAAGPEPFTGETFVPSGPPSTLNIPTSSTMLATTTTAGPSTTQPGPTTTVAGVQVASVSGDSPALYGGSKGKLLVDKEGQLRFFEQNPEKAAAFCAALNADPSFKWSGGTRLEPSQLRAYFEELTPMMLTRDTRVTNHGFRNGQPTPRQAVLQKGQMVLVDRYGVPRIRSECGNPLAQPIPVKKTPTYTGPKWPDFDPTTIVIVQPTIVVIEIFVVIDIYTGQPFDRPWGTEGVEDVEHTSVWQLDIAMVYEDDAGHSFRVDWTGAVTLDTQDGSLTGEGAGEWYVEGPYYEGDQPIGQMWGRGSLSVDLSGQLDSTSFGDMLTIFPVMSGFTLDDQAWDGPDPQDARADFEGAIEGLIAMSFDTVLELAATDAGPVLADFEAGPWLGSATLAPYEP